MKMLARPALAAGVIALAAAAAPVTTSFLTAAAQAQGHPYSTPPKDRSQPRIRRCWLERRKVCWTDKNGQRRCAIRHRYRCIGNRSLGNQ